MQVIGKSYFSPVLAGALKKNEKNVPLKRTSLSKAKPRNRQSLPKKRRKSTSDKWNSDESEEENEGEEDSEDDFFLSISLEI